MQTINLRRVKVGVRRPGEVGATDQEGERHSRAWVVALQPGVTGLAKSQKLCLAKSSVLTPWGAGTPVFHRVLALPLTDLVGSPDRSFQLDQGEVLGSGCLQGSSLRLDVITVLTSHQ